MEDLLKKQQFLALVDGITVQTLDHRVLALSLTPTSVDDSLARLCQYWPIAKQVLKAAKWITPPKIDKIIDEVIAIVSSLCGTPTDTEKSDLLQRFAAIWGTIKPILLAAKNVTGPKVDLIIDEIVKIGDLLSKS